MEHVVISAISQHGYLAIFLLMTLESACIPIPSEVIMLFGGALTAGTSIAGVEGHLNVVLVALLGALGNLFGSLLAYWVGRSGGRAIVERWGKYILLRKHDLDKAEDFFAHRGEWTVLFGRMLPVIRTFISFPAGIAEMPIVKFSFLSFIGCLPWTFALAFIGKSLADNWQSVSKASRPISMVIAAVVAIAAVWWYTKRRKSNESSVSER